MLNPPLRLELGTVARIILDRPDKHNAMSVEMGDLLRASVQQINQNPDVRVVVVQGEGRAFCAGGDFDVIAANAKRSPEDNRVGMLEFYRSFLSILRVRAPTIAKIHGAAVGAGLCLAMACDIRVAASEAKLGANFVRVGLHPGMGCTLFLPRLVGEAKAAELIFTGELIDGGEALRIGLVNAAVPRANLDQKMDALIARLVSGAPIALAQAKSTLLAPLLRRLDEALDREANAQAIDFTTADLSEAVSAFRESRTPIFSGS